MDFIVNDMTCNHCKSTIEKAVAEAGGQAQIDLAAHRVSVSQLAPATAEKVIREAGYTPQPA